MALEFPFQNAPQKDDRRIVEICPEVLWVRLPLPMSLDHINCYLIKDGDGWCIIDTGMPGQDGESHWENIFKELADKKSGNKITQVIVTHQHMDHVGLAGYLCRKFSAPLHMSKMEYLTVRAFSQSWLDEEEPYWHTAQYFSRSGIDESIIEGIKSMRENRKQEKKNTSPLPSSYIRIQDKQVLTIGEHQWQAISSAGHSPEHISLYCETLNLYISGDQVLPKITSNVSVMPTEPEANPLQDWIDGLQKIKALLPDSPLVLPSHELPFYGLHERVDGLIAHHEERMNILLTASKESSRNATELTRILFDRELEPFSLFMATGECLAHLHCLMARGEIKRSMQGECYCYRTA